MTTPTKPGWYWAKLVRPTNMPEGEDWASSDWEIVEVYENCLDETDDEYLAVFVGGIGPSQWLKDFEWGPEVKDKPPC